MKRIFPIVLLLFLIISFCTIPILSKRNLIRTNFELEKADFPSTKIFLLNQDDYLVEINVILPRGEKVPNIIEYLKEGYDGEWMGYIPQNTKILKYEKTQDQLDVYFSNELKKMNSKYLIGIKKSLENIKNINTVRIWIEEELITNIPTINLEQDFMNRGSIEKIVVYYVDQTEKRNYVPVTKYIKEGQSKIETILEELKNNTPKNLVSYISNKLELIDYEEENDVILLNFNKELEKDSTAKQWVMNEIANSIFDSYDVSTVIIKIAGKIEKVISKNNENR